MARNKMIDRILSDENMKTAKQRLFQKVADTELSLKKSKQLLLNTEEQKTRSEKRF